LTWGEGESQTRSMAHTYIRFDFGTDEEKAQQARHKLDGWRQAFRLDKRVQYKLERPEGPTGEGAKPAATAETAVKPAAEKGKVSGKGKQKAEAKAKPSEAAPIPAAAADGKVGLLVRLYFSSHEKLSEQRWLERIPSEEPFQSASPKVIHSNDPEFEKADQQFESLD
jgi:hypothetical protein